MDFAVDEDVLVLVQRLHEMNSVVLGVLVGFLEVSMPVNPNWFRVTKLLHHTRK